MQKAIVIGASSGIGRALAIKLSQEGFEVGIAARRVEQLESLQKELKTKSYLEHLDLFHIDEAQEKFEKLLKTMGDVDLIIINSGIILNNPSLDFEKEKKTIDVNVTGFTAMACLSMKYF